MKKPLLTGQEIRHNAKQRLKRHREEMEKRGYKTVSVFMSQELRAELDRLSVEGMTKHKALEHIFDVYSMNTKELDSSKVTDIGSPEYDKIIFDFIHERSKQGLGYMTFKRIRDELNFAGLLTKTGKTWNSDTNVGSAYKALKKRFLLTKDTN